MKQQQSNICKKKAKLAAFKLKKRRKRYFSFYYHFLAFYGFADGTKTLFPDRESNPGRGGESAES